MTYFEWVNNLVILKNSPMDYELLKKLENSKFDGSQYTYYRLTKHINDTISDRLNKAFDGIINGVSNFNISIDDLSLELIRYRDEVKFINKILGLSVIPKDSLEIIKTDLNKALNDIYKYIRDSVEYIDVDGEYISTFDKIMNNLEE